ncbi:Flp pilus assembly protein TadB [Crossiella equi]|uniref:Flp pilus assembly protein TadB n=1 Tax=Crossiella equi TaxID=130796 RepID=A0ABS5AN37_9PSEU|nr:DUF3040 domain-containing protein [Crossiella equi]MBP2477988.1 Flp pilus assembly protein TadB [Crossiella equi]
MLSQGDRRRLDEIASQLAAADPTFVEGLRAGHPAAPCDDRRWPPVLAGLVAFLMFLVALAAVSLPLMLACLVGMTWSVVSYRDRVRRGHCWRTRPRLPR